MVLSVGAKAAGKRKILDERRRFLEREIRRKKETLHDFPKSPGVAHPGITIARAIVGLTIRQFELELEWLQEAEKALGAARAGNDRGS